MVNKKITLRSNWIIFILIVTFSFLYSLLALIRHNRFESFAYDLGLYDQAIWLYSQFKIPFSTIKIPNMVLLGDHFAPSLALLSPLLWVWNDVRILLIAQALVVVTGVFPIYRIAEKIIKNRIFSLSISLSYLLFYGVQNALSFDIHAITFASGLLPWLFLFLEEKKYKLYWLLFFILLGFKEDIPVILFSIGIFAILQLKLKKVGLLSIVLSGIYFLIVAKLLIPALSGIFSHESNVPSGIKEWLTFMFIPLVKTRTVFFSLLPFIFLPLFCLPALIPIIFHFAEHFLDPRFSGRFEMALHYRVPLAALMSIATIYGLQSLRNKIESDKLPIILSLFLLSSAVFNQVYLHLPLNTLLKSNFYQRESWMGDNTKMINKIPKNASVITQNNLIPHLSHRNKIFLSSIVLKPCSSGLLCKRFLYEDADYLLLDLRSDQSINNFWGEPLSSVKITLDNELSAGQFILKEKLGGVYLYEKIRN